MRERKKNKVELAREQILREITIGNYPRGAALPPEREMAEQIEEAVAKGGAEQ